MQIAYLTPHLLEKTGNAFSTLFAVPSKSCFASLREEKDCSSDAAIFSFFCFETICANKSPKNTFRNDYIIAPVVSYSNCFHNFRPKIKNQIMRCASFYKRSRENPRKIYTHSNQQQTNNFQLLYHIIKL